MLPASQKVRPPLYWQFKTNTKNQAEGFVLWCSSFSLDRRLTDMRFKEKQENIAKLEFVLRGTEAANKINRSVLMVRLPGNG